LAHPCQDWAQLLKYIAQCSVAHAALIHEQYSPWEYSAMNHPQINEITFCFTELFIGSNMLRFAVKMLRYSRNHTGTRLVPVWYVWKWIEGWRAVCFLKERPAHLSIIELGIGDPLFLKAYSSSFWISLYLGSIVSDSSWTWTASVYVGGLSFWPSISTKIEFRKNNISKPIILGWKWHWKALHVGTILKNFPRNNFRGLS